MSRKLQEKELDLTNLDVITADKVWNKNKLRKNKPTLSKNYKYYGRVERGFSAFVTTSNSIGENHKFVIDTNKLPKKIKNKMIDYFKNKNKKVLYLIKK